jgi:hypothetical protein
MDERRGAGIRPHAMRSMEERGTDTRGVDEHVGLERLWPNGQSYRLIGHLDQRNQRLQTGPGTRPVNGHV